MIFSCPSPRIMTTSCTYNPCLIALCPTTALPRSVRGPDDILLLRRLASIFFEVVLLGIFIPLLFPYVFTKLQTCAWETHAFPTRAKDLLMVFPSRFSLHSPSLPCST